MMQVTHFLNQSELFLSHDLTCILRLDCDDTLPLRTEALRGSSLNLELIRNVLSQVGNSQTGLRAIAIYLERALNTWGKQQKDYD